MATKKNSSKNSRQKTSRKSAEAQLSKNAKVQRSYENTKSRRDLSAAKQESNKRPINENRRSEERRSNARDDSRHNRRLDDTRAEKIYDRDYALRAVRSPYGSYRGENKHLDSEQEKMNRLAREARRTYQDLDWDDEVEYRDTDHFRPTRSHRHPDLKDPENYYYIRSERYDDEDLYEDEIDLRETLYERSNRIPKGYVPREEYLIYLEDLDDEDFENDEDDYQSRHHHDSYRPQRQMALKSRNGCNGSCSCCYKKFRRKN